MIEPRIPEVPQGAHRRIASGPPRTSARLTSVVGRLCSAAESRDGGERARFGAYPPPSPGAIEGMLDDLRALLFPLHFGRTGPAPEVLRQFVERRLDRAHAVLVEQLEAGLAFSCEHAPGSARERCRTCDARAREIADALIASLPRLREQIDTDATAAYEGDPAARFLDETLFCYPGVRAITNHRIAHELEREGVPLVPRMIAELSHAATGIDLHPGAQIGPSFFIDHGTGVVIGETTVIGARVRIYQGVTLGARDVRHDEHGRAARGGARHPIVEDDVVIYAGATILGRIVIGRGARIGGNVWLTRSVPPGCQVSQPHYRARAFEGGSGI